MDMLYIAPKDLQSTHYLPRPQAGPKLTWPSTSNQLGRETNARLVSCQPPLSRRQPVVLVLYALHVEQSIVCTSKVSAGSIKHRVCIIPLWRRIFFLTFWKLRRLNALLQWTWLKCAGGHSTGPGQDCAAIFRGKAAGRSFRCDIR